MSRFLTYMITAWKKKDKPNKQITKWAIALVLHQLHKSGDDTII